VPFQRIEAEKVATSIIRQIEGLILRGVLRPGERLPPERALAERMGVSRPSLRAALSGLEESQLLVTKPGSGVFVADVLGSVFSDPLIALFASHDEALFDYLAFRRDLEVMAAERAANAASDTELKMIDTLFEKLAGAADTESAEIQAGLDADFHMAIVEASHNIIMLHTMRSMLQMLRAGVFYNRQAIFQQNTTRQALLQQHRQINAAIQDRDPAKAASSVREHLDFVETALKNQRALARNEVTAQQRFARSASDST